MKTRALPYAILVIAVILAVGVGCNKAPRNDAQVASDVQAKILGDGSIQSRQIQVQADSGVVTLNGSVVSESERAVAAADAATIEGVKTVVNNLQVQQAQVTPPPAPVEETVPPPAAPEPKREVRREKPQPATTTHVKHKGSDENSAPTRAENNPPQQMQPPIQPPAQAAVPSTPPPPPQPQKVTVPAGTQLTVRLSNPLDSETNQLGDIFHGTLGAPIVVDGETVIPTGADVTGRVADVKSAGRFAGNSVLTLELTSLSVNSRTYNLQTNAWSRAGKGEGKNTAVKAGGGAAIGALIGGLAAGGRGAAIGAAAGGATGTGVAATKKGEQIKLGSESALNFQLTNPLTVVAQSTNDRNAGRTPLPQ